ncbi:MAG: alpha-E domain-containing protein [Hyphomicrobiaceae bacterium]|nr:alpha-E domain-containing protein [Hyphomicrobiaceae bacterium]
MLGKTANGLFWMSRYIERAENTARLVQVGLRMALTRSSSGEDEWASLLATAGATTAFFEKHDAATAMNVVDFLIRDQENASSVLACMNAARTNARLVRTAVTREVWENVNQAWMDLHTLLRQPIREADLPYVLTDIKRDGSLIRGAFDGTMLRNEVYDFARIGTFVERADNTARILDVKYYVLLPSVAFVGSTLDNIQWESILRSVSGQRSYRWVYDANYQPANIADFLILNGRMPRSLAFSYKKIVDNLKYLNGDPDSPKACQRTAQRNMNRLHGRSVADIFEYGLHEFLTEFIEDNNRLSQEIAEDFLFV